MKMQLGRRSRLVASLLLEAIILIGAYMAYEAVRLLVAPNSHEAIERGLSLISIEQRLGIFFEPNLQRHVVDHHWLVTMLNWVYVWGYLPVIGAAGIYLYLAHRSFYSRYRNAFLLSGAIGLVIFATLPVAPPRMFPEFGFTDTVRDNSAIYSSFEGSDLVNEFAAVPSFHFGWILLVGLAVIQTNHSRLVRIGALLLPLLMLSAIVLTANHYLIDAAAGAAIVIVALAVVSIAERPGLLPTFRRTLSAG
ncbi:MAG TPA: phosphatase PAP2 family protein [Dehalococcoidia bacterium]|nr:phosphatase PAP2 family protein [Dehalococcoidia bacterium]